MVSLDVATRINAVTRVFGKEMREGWDRVTIVMQEARGCAESELSRSWGESIHRPHNMLTLGQKTETVEV
jgi:hypothetical protein